ncbi:shikimate dehydrogenase [Microbacterium sp.]|uniref:shikimate dehydrogenase n=1 Tax=Microbacterium sp. TaxID=51671 RepID=UPI0025E646FE|nr:shikimate dehydrogenase [Microbacterium sp.]
MTAEVADRPRFEVWGDPIAHSLSPRIHSAAYERLGWDWAYGRRQVAAAAFGGELERTETSLRGLSITFPLKTEAHRAATSRDGTAELTGAVNTLVLAEGRRLGFNTDVGGIVADVRSLGIETAEIARIVGAGATATSALVALAHLGARAVDVVARRPDAAAHLVALGKRLAVAVAVVPPETAAAASVPLTISTLPGGAVLPAEAADRLAAGGGLLYDVVYGHWPTPLAEAWGRAGAPAVDGRGMLLRQAVLQIRAFATGEVTQPLPDEEDVVAVMRSALMGD